MHSRAAGRAKPTCRPEQVNVRGVNVRLTAKLLHLYVLVLAVSQNHNYVYNFTVCYTHVLVRNICVCVI